MTTNLGFAGTIEVSNDGGSNYYPVTKAFEVSYDDIGDIIDDTTNDDGGYKSEKGGLLQYSLGFSFQYQVSDANGQGKVRTAARAKTALKWRYRPLGNVAGEEQHVFNGIPKLTRPAPTGAIIGQTCTTNTSGTIANTTI